MDAVRLIFYLVTICYSYKRTVAATNRINYILKSDLTDAQFDDVVSMQNIYSCSAALSLFLSWIKIFKYISVNKTMSQLSATLSRSSKDIGGFGVMFAVFFFAYAQFGYLVFGTQISDYSTFYSAVFTLLRTILGDFDFHSLEKVNYILGPLFFITYVFFVFFILLNMFLAIINDSYVEVKAELARKCSGEGITDWIKRKIKSFGKSQGSPCETKEYVTFGNYRQQLIKAGCKENDLDELFNNYSIASEDFVTEKAISEIEDEIRVIQNRRKILHEHHEEYVILSRRVNKIETTISEVVDRICATLRNLEKLEHKKIMANERQNRFYIQASK